MSKIDIDKIVDELMKEIERPSWMDTLHPAAMDNALRENIKKRVISANASHIDRESLIEEIVRLQYERDELSESLPSADY